MTAAVAYSLVCDPAGFYERQWMRSVTSLRRHNPAIDVAVCVYGAPRPQTLHTAHTARAHVVTCGAYRRALGDLPAHWRQALGRLHLHKLLSLARLAATPAAPLLYLDCDTYVCGDLNALCDRYDGWGWSAREEPGSARSPHGYDPACIDEPGLARIAGEEGLVPVPPYNTGVFRVSGEAAVTLAALVEDFLWYAWRLLIGACLWRPEIVTDSSLPGFVLSSARSTERRLALPYPSANFWILDQVAMWLTLGRVPGLTHCRLAPEDVVQNGEYAGARGYTVAHYYSAGEAAFDAFLRRTGQGAAALAANGCGTPSRPSDHATYSRPPAM